MGRNSYFANVVVGIRGGHNAPKSKIASEVGASWHHLTNNYETFLLAVFSSGPTAIAQGPSKWQQPLYRSKLNVFQSTPCWYSKLVSQEA